MIVVGLTGSIGMGKSTTSAMFAELGVPVHDADKAVHDLYSGKAVPLVEKAFPGVVVDGRIDRERLSTAVLGDPAAIRRLEAIVHPLVREAEQEFLERNRAAGVPMVILDIPLLFETGGESRVDRIVVVSAPEEVQRDRVLARPGMDERKFETILARQLSDAQKRERADFVIDTSQGVEHARNQVAAIVDTLVGD
jgi:dephospho-CoA kinase